MGSQSQEEQRRLTHVFSPPERRGLIAGWRGGQLASVASGLLVGMVILRTYPTVAGLIFALAAACLSIAIATVPIYGLAAEEWLPSVIRYAVTYMQCGGRRLSAIPGSGEVVVITGKHATVDGLEYPTSSRAGGRLASRYPLDRYRILDVRSAGGNNAPVPGVIGTASSDFGGEEQSIGIVHDPLRSTYTAVFSLMPHGFLLDDPETQQQKVRSWAFALASLAREGSPVYRVQWVVHSIPGAGLDPKHYYESRRTVEAATEGCISYEELLGAVASHARRYQIYITLTVRAGSVRAGSSWKERDGGRFELFRKKGYGSSIRSSEEKMCTELLREAAAFRRKLLDTGEEMSAIFSPESYRRCIRMGWEYGDDGIQSDSGASDKRAGTQHGTWPWPVAAEEYWDCIHVESGWHTSYWVSQWPRIAVPSDFLSPLLLQVGACSKFSVVMEPVAPLKAMRQVEQARTTYLADQELRRKGGFLHTDKQRREHEALLQREQELGEGHAQFRFCGYATVSAGSSDELSDARHRFEQAAGQAGIDCRKLYGRQLDALAYTIPLGEGLD
jgi:hypothetical protein